MALNPAALLATLLMLGGLAKRSEMVMDALLDDMVEYEARQENRVDDLDEYREFGRKAFKAMSDERLGEVIVARAIKNPRLQALVMLELRPAMQTVEL